MRELIRDRQRSKAEAALRTLIAEGLASGPAQPVDPAFFKAQRKRLRR